MNIKEIKELIKMLDGTDIAEFNLESEGNRLIIKKNCLTNQAQIIPAYHQGVTMHCQTHQIPLKSRLNLPMEH